MYFNIHMAFITYVYYHTPHPLDNWSLLKFNFLLPAIMSTGTYEHYYPPTPRSFSFFFCSNYFSKNTHISVSEHDVWHGMSFNLKKDQRGWSEIFGKSWYKFNRQTLILNNSTSVPCITVHVLHNTKVAHKVFQNIWKMNVISNRNRTRHDTKRSTEVEGLKRLHKASRFSAN